MLSRRAKLLSTIDELEANQNKLGPLPREALEAELALSAQSANAMWANIERLQVFHQQQIDSEPTK